MNTHTDDNLSAMLTGMATSAAAHLLRRDTDTQNRIDQQRDDIYDLTRRLRDLMSNGHLIRDSYPVVADVLSGIALARSVESTATLLPSLDQINRPALINILQSAISNFSWPPKEGEYTSNGYIQKAGELVSLGLILTYEEVRAFLHGLVLDGSPTQAQKLQVFFAAAGLVRATADRSFSQQGWRAVWDRLFGPAPHPNAPTVATLIPAAAVQTLAGARDSAMVVTLVVGAGGINAGVGIAKVTFGTKYTNVPAVIIGGPFRAESINNQDFVIMTTQGFAPGETATLSIIVGSTDG